MKVLVTGVNGYIGSHIAQIASEAGHQVDGLDQTITSNYSIVNQYLHQYHMRSILGDVGSLPEYDAVIHCAALISVPESMEKPTLYYNVNTTATMKMLTEMKYKHFIFASTGGAFDPISPYAKSKLIAEEAVRQIAPNYSIFRFFNVAGSNGSYRQIGPASHIIRIAAEAAVGRRKKMIVFGNDYDTPDGTCIRDYVHIVDLARTIVRSIDNPANSNYECIGSGVDYSNLQVINTMKKVTGVDFPVEFGPRRSGDPAKLVVDTASKYVRIDHTLKDMCHSAYTMELK